MDKKWIDCVNKLYCALDLNRRAVSVTFLKTKAEYDEAEGSILKKPINYCQMVASAARGHSIKAKAEDFLCQSGVQVFGLGPLNPCNSKGENWARLGLYKDAELSRTVRGELVYLPQKYFGVTVAPVEKQSGFPDVVLIVSNPYNVMRIVQGYAYSYGMPKSVNLIGNQAVCLECTARPYAVKDMNLSLLCIGTRHRARWEDEEMAVGIPGEQFADVVTGLMSTLNQMENDENKKKIEVKLKRQNIPFEIRYGYNYYMDC